VRASLPRSSTVSIEVAGQLGTGEAVVTATRSRSDTILGGMHTASGLDERGPWELGGMGVTLRLSPVEATSQALDDFLTHRRYLEVPLDATCDPNRGRPIVLVQPKSAVPGEPKLTFDLATAELVEVRHVGSDGTHGVTKFESWTPPDEHGVRWPLVTRDRDEIGNETIVKETSAKSGLFCSHAKDEACLAVPPSSARFAWPSSGSIRVPFVLEENEILFKMRVEGREVWALLDSGASTTAIDATRPVVAGFKPALTIEGSGVDQTMKVGLGTLEKVEVAGMAIEQLPVASVPLSALDGFDHRPELILGFSVFAAGTLRIDYAKKEFVLSKASEGQIAKDATSLPLRVLDGKPVIDATIEGQAIAVEVDTGNNGGIQLTDTWAKSHGLPGKRPVAKLRGMMGAGTQESESLLFRVREIAFGPVKATETLVGTMTTPAPGTIGGLLGNELLGRCSAVIFDVPTRALWLEGPCNRDVAVSRGGLRLTRAESPKHKDHPWVIGGLMPSGAAERAGLEGGDRVLEVDGKPATERETIEKALAQPRGTKVKLVVVRGGKKKTVELVLADAVGLLKRTAHSGQRVWAEDCGLTAVRRWLKATLPLRAAAGAFRDRARRRPPSSTRARAAAACGGRARGLPTRAP
jgi:hypothetical protein